MIYNGLLLTMGKNLPVIENGAVVIRDTKIYDCGENLDQSQL